MTSPIDHALAKARLRPRPYPSSDITAAEARIAARVADRMLHGALSFDDRTQPAKAYATLFRPLQPPPGAPGCDALQHEATAALSTLCRTAVAHPGALHQMSSFLSLRILEPDGACVLGCVLQLAAREDSARFWWQFAAGAGDAAAAYFLYLHHMALGELGEADWWYAQAEAEHGPFLVIDTDSPTDSYHQIRGLRMLGILTGAQQRFTAEAAAVIDYVPGAVRFVDDVDLPLPEPDFAERIEELTATP